MELEKTLKLKIIDFISTELSKKEYKSLSFNKALELICKNMPKQLFKKYFFEQINLIPKFKDEKIFKLTGVNRYNEIIFDYNLEKIDIDCLEKSFVNMTLEEKIKKYENKESYISNKDFER